MKKLSALLLLAVGIALGTGLQAAEKKAATKPAAKPAAAAPAAKQAAVAPAAKPATATPAKDEKKAEEPLVGVLIERKTGGFANLRVDEGKLTLAFLDAEKKETVPNVTKATIRFRKGLSTERYLLTPEGKTLRSPLPVPRPYVFFKVRVVLFDDDEETANEVYLVNFKQPMPGDGEGTPADKLTPQQLQKAPAPKAK